MEIQLASFGDLDRISTIEKETNEYPWSFNNFKSSLDAGNSSIVLKDKKNIIGYCITKWKMKSYLTSNSSDNNFISFLRKNIAIRFGIETKATTTYAMFQTTVVSITAAKIKHKT